MILICWLFGHRPWMKRGPLCLLCGRCEHVDAQTGKRYWK